MKNKFYKLYINIGKSNTLTTGFGFAGVPFQVWKATHAQLYTYLCVYTSVYLSAFLNCLGVLSTNVELWPNTMVNKKVKSIFFYIIYQLWMLNCRTIFMHSVNLTERNW